MLLLLLIGEKLDSNLTPILEKNIIKSKGGLFIRSGDQMIEYNPNFRLYITTCLRNPHYPPEVMVMVSLTYAVSQHTVQVKKVEMNKECGKKGRELKFVASHANDDVSVV